VWAGCARLGRGVWAAVPGRGEGEPVEGSRGCVCARAKGARRGETAPSAALPSDSASCWLMRRPSTPIPMPSRELTCDITALPILAVAFAVVRACILADAADAPSESSVMSSCEGGARGGRWKQAPFSPRMPRALSAVWPSAARKLSPGTTRRTRSRHRRTWCTAD
jgi:hypothetical protein